MEILLPYFKAFSDLTRLKILKLLLHRELAVCELACVLNTSQPAVSQHLAKLRHLGLITERREGLTCYCQVDREKLAEFQACFQGFINIDMSELTEMSQELVRLADAGQDEGVQCCKAGKDITASNEG